VRDLESIREMSWVVRARAGDRDAFLSLVQQYERRLLCFIRRFERDPSAAVDVLQNVWLIAWKSIRGLHKPEAFRTWLYRIAHGAVVGSIRAEKRRREVEQDRSQRLPNRSAPPPDQIVDAVDLLDYALEQLSLEHRVVVTLRFLEDMSVDEIAAATESPAGTVKSRLHYAKQALQKAIQEETNEYQSPILRIDRTAGRS
jgi:RNA polymerase sigma-70 factor (ECF subfamily)